MIFCTSFASFLTTLPRKSRCSLAPHAKHSQSRPQGIGFPVADTAQPLRLWKAFQSGCGPSRVERLSRRTGDAMSEMVSSGGKPSREILTHRRRAADRLDCGRRAGPRRGESDVLRIDNEPGGPGGHVSGAHSPRPLIPRLTRARRGRTWTFTFARMHVMMTRMRLSQRLGVVGVVVCSRGWDSCCRPSDPNEQPVASHSRERERARRSARSPGRCLERRCHASHAQQRRGFHTESEDSDRQRPILLGESRQSAADVEFIGRVHVLDVGRARPIRAIQANQRPD